jgi:UDP-N-acetyl-D-mannosaminuronic acid dehydrogenase
VVLGGGGHVGLPLSLAFAAAGMRVGVFDTNAATLEDLAAGRMPFREIGADALLQELLPTGRLVFDTSPSILGRTSQVESKRKSNTKSTT